MNSLIQGMCSTPELQPSWMEKKPTHLSHDERPPALLDPDPDVEVTVDRQDQGVKDRPVPGEAVLDSGADDEQGRDELEAVDGGLQVVDDVVQRLHRLVAMRVVQVQGVVNQVTCKERLKIVDKCFTKYFLTLGSTLWVAVSDQAP